MADYNFPWRARMDRQRKGLLDRWRRAGRRSRVPDFGERNEAIAELISCRLIGTRAPDQLKSHTIHGKVFCVAAIDFNSTTVPQFSDELFTLKTAHFLHGRHLRSNPVDANKFRMTRSRTALFIDPQDTNDSKLNFV